MPAHKGTYPRRFDITQADITSAVARDSAFCPVATVIARELPNAQRIMVDIASIRWTDTVTRKRYVFITPIKVQQFIIDFDRGYHDRVKPISFWLQHPAQIAGIRDRRGRDRSAEKTQNIEARKSKRSPRQKSVLTKHANGDVTKIGGHTAPVGRRFRQFGGRALIP